METDLSTHTAVAVGRNQRWQPPRSSCLAKRARQQHTVGCGLFQCVEGWYLISLGLKYFREKEGKML